MPNVEITGLTRVRAPKPNKGGSVVLAYFDCEVAGFSLAGCAFVRTSKNGLVIWPPRLDGPEASRRSVHITDDSIRHAIMLQARETYRALGGTDAEWVGRSIPLGPDGGDEMLRTERRPQRNAEPEHADDALPIILPPPIRRAIPVTRRTVVAANLEAISE